MYSDVADYSASAASVHASPREMNPLQSQLLPRCLRQVPWRTAVAGTKVLWTTRVAAAVVHTSVAAAVGLGC